MRYTTGMSPVTLFLAQYIGIFCVSIALVMSIRKKTVIEVFHELAHNHTISHLFSMAMLWISIFMLLRHNAWGNDLEIAVSLVGWLLFAEAVLWVFLPRRMFQHLYDSMRKPFFFRTVNAIYWVIGILFLVVGFCVYA